MSSYRSLLSHWTSQQTNILISAAGNAKIYLKKKKITIVISSRASHSQSKHSSKRVITHTLFISPSPLTLFFHFLGNFFFDFLDTFFFFLDTFFSSWTLFLFFFSGDHLSYCPQFVGLYPTVTTGLISGCACLGVPAIKSAVPMSPPPRVNLLVPVPAATYNTCSAHNKLSFQSKCRSVMPTLYLSITHFKLSTISIQKVII